MATTRKKPATPAKAQTSIKLTQDDLNVEMRALLEKFGAQIGITLFTPLGKPVAMDLFIPDSFRLQAWPIIPQDDEADE